MGFGGFSWKRAVGITKLKGRISRKTRIPLTRSGRQRKIGKMITGGRGGCLVTLILAMSIFAAGYIALGETGDMDPCEVSRIIDGDTFICASSGEEYRVRLIGMDTPELPTPEGVEAREYVEGIMPAGTVVRLELDVQTYDRYRRVLAYVYLPSGDMLNEVLLREGKAGLMTVPPNVAKSEAFRAIVEKRH